MQALSTNHASSPKLQADTLWIYSPSSQASSYPTTPLLSNLPEPVLGPHADIPCLPKGDHQDWGSPFRFVRTLSGHSTQAPDEMEPLPCTPTGDAHGNDQGIFLPVLPPLQSELGRLCQSIVLAEERLEQYCQEQQPVMVGEKDFVLDNSSLKAVTKGLAYRRSKKHSDRDHTVPGLDWGATVTGLDQGDGWIQVGEHFLPKELDNVAVLVPQTEKMQDVPALTADGCAVDLRTAAAVSFLRDAEPASAITRAKDHASLLHAARLAHAACEAEALIEADGVCAIDAAGIIRNQVFNWKEEGPSNSSRWKYFFRRMQYRRSSACRDITDQLCRLCTGPDGKVFLLLYPEGITAGHNRSQGKRRKLCRRKSLDDGDAVIIDVNGVVHL